jgi:putative phosphoribosyl transferase
VIYPSRAAAGHELGRVILKRGICPTITLGLPRGGVVVAAPVAHELKCPLDCLVVRKLGHPKQPEFAVGALAEGGVIVLDHFALKRNHVNPRDLDWVIAAESRSLRDYEAKFHPRGRVNLSGATVLIVDDGLATGLTTKAAIQSVRQQEAREVIVAAPVGSTHAVQRLSGLVDDLIVLTVDPEFTAVGQYYADFPQTEDAEVVALLNLDGSR